jgi:hypothetical protein
LVAQAVLAIVVLMGLVAGVTFYFMYQGLDYGGGDPPPPPPTTAAKALKFAEQADEKVIRRIWDPPTQGEFEEGTNGHYDFWFENPQDVPVELGIAYKSCKCTVPSVCILSPEETQRYRTWSYGSAAAHVALAHQGMLPLLGQMQLDQEVTPGWSRARLDWQPLPVNDDQGVPVGPHFSGMLRIAWDGTKAQSGSQLLKVDIWMQAQEGTSAPRARQTIELPVFWVTPLQFVPPTLDAGELNPQQKRELLAVCWSSTRSWFPLHIEEKRGEPYFHCTCQPLTAEQRNAFAEGMRKKPAKEGEEPGPKPRVLYAYQVHITVQERVSETARMDMGPFGRKIVVAGPDSMVAEVPLSGTVRGEIQVGGEDDNGKIRLGQFKAKTGTQKTVRLTANRPGLQLEFHHLELEHKEEKSLPFLKLKGPTAVGSSAEVMQWELRVQVPPGGSPRLLENCAVVLKLVTPGGAYRFIRIPITGAAISQ